MSSRKITWAPPRAGRGATKLKQSPKQLSLSTSTSTPEPSRAVPAVLGKRQRSPSPVQGKAQEDSGQRSGSGRASKSRKRSTAGAAMSRRFQPTESVGHPTLMYRSYHHAVKTGEVVFLHIDPRTWIAELHDGHSGERRWGVDAWTVIQSHVNLLGQVSYSCSPCPDYAKHKTCVHVMVLANSKPADFELFTDRDDPECVCFDHDALGRNGETGTMFVLMSQSAKPVFLSHFRNEEGKDAWMCSHDNQITCIHVAKAKKTIAYIRISQEFQDNEESEQPEAEDGDLRRAEEERQRADELSLRELHEERSVSWRPVGPPAWSRLPSDTTPSFKTVRPFPRRICLDEHARCRCGSNEGVGDINVLKGTIYATDEACEVEIEVRKCAKCAQLHSAKRQFIGPDPRDLGLFNFNNLRIYTHELLNRFTNSISAHETPFHGFCTVIRRTYIESGCNIPFAVDDAFRTAYFSFTRIQDLGDSFKCEKCGPNPKIVIFDGVTAGFNNKHRTSTLSPPTALKPNAPVRDGVRPPVTATSLVWGKLRVLAQKAIRWRMQLKGSRSKVGGIGAGSSDDGSGNDDDDELSSAADADVDIKAASNQAKKRMSKRDALDASIRSSFPSIVKDLGRLNKALESLFSAHVCSERNTEMTRPYLELLEHVFAAESALLFIPQTTWLYLSQLVAGDAAAAEELLRDVPALGVVARQELQQNGKFSAELQQLTAFILARAIHVRSTLSDHKYENATPVQDADDWRESGVFYGRPQIRLRPRYPNLPSDQKIDRAVVSEDAAGGIGCNKFYETYGKRGLTGGLMAAWCPHCVCIGFHCIPKGEGRNDVYSALFTFWEDPPDVVIYDFACALGPYCMLREPKFFERTRFLIDGFHAKGHKKCTKACFISSYKKNSPGLLSVNSSAAECGNGGLVRIRRPLSYMSQRHAIVYTRTYLATWNRKRRLEH